MSGEALRRGRMTRAVLRSRCGTFTAYAPDDLEPADAVFILVRKLMIAAAKQAIRYDLDPNEALWGTLKFRPPLDLSASGTTYPETCATG